MKFENTGLITLGRIRDNIYEAFEVLPKSFNGWAPVCSSTLRR